MKQLLLTLILFCAAIAAYAQGSGENITGLWLNEEHSAKIEIAKDGDSYSGKIIWLAKETDKNGNPLVDKMNPDKQKQNRTILGLTILYGIKYVDGEWSGSIYAPKAGQSANCTVKLNGADNLQIKVSRGFFSQTKNWTRVK